ncbi:hypothetical protein SprV_0602231200 [Sparganum proliferum]
MGSPISGFIAEAVLQRLESLVFQHHRPKFWARYVDDTFVVIERDQVLTFQEHLNAVFPDIQFTMEEGENNQLAFPDVLNIHPSANDSGKGYIFSYLFRGCGNRFWCAYFAWRFCPTSGYSSRRQIDSVIFVETASQLGFHLCDFSLKIVDLDGQNMTSTTTLACIFCVRTVKEIV